jgi:dihydroxy-acid dehydratase
MGGPIALIEAGDRIVIDIPNRSISLKVSLEILEQRRGTMIAKGTGTWHPAEPRARSVSGVLKAYAALATSASRGAVRDLSQIDRT